MYSGFAIIKIQGGLGNQLFQYVFGKYMQKYFNYKLLFFYPGSEETPGPMARACQLQYLCNVPVITGWRAQALNMASLSRISAAALAKTKVVGVYSDCEKNCIVLPEHRQFDKPYLFRLISVFRGSWHNLPASLDILDDVKIQITSCLQNLLATKSHLDSIDYGSLLANSVILHVRIGDSHDKLSSDYYQRAFDALNAKHPIPAESKIYFISDQPRKAEKMLAFLGKSLIELPFDDPLLAMSALAMARYKILSHSTFSLWGALLSNRGSNSIYPLMQSTPSPWWDELEALQGVNLIKV